MELLIGELQFRVVGRTAHREDAEKTPCWDTQRYKIFFKFLQVRIIPRIDTCYNVPQQVLLLRQQLDGLRGPFERLRMTPHPIVLFLEAVETDGDGVHAAGQQAVEPLLVQQEAVGDHPPRILTPIEFEAHLLQIVAQQRLAAAEDNKDLVGVDMWSD